MSNEDVAREFWKQSMDSGSAQIVYIDTVFSMHIQVEFGLTVPIIMDVAGVVCCHRGSSL